MVACRLAVQGVALEYIELFGSAGKADEFRSH